MQGDDGKHSKKGADKQGLWGLVPVLVFIMLIFRVYGVTNLFDVFSADVIDTWVVVGGVESLLFAVVAVYLLVLFFKKRKEFPKYFTYYLFSFLLVSIVTAILRVVFYAAVVSPDASATVVATVTASLLSFFLFSAAVTIAIVVAVKKSERVRLTFIH